MRDLYVTAAFIFVLIVLYRFRAPFLRALRRFDAENIARQEQEFHDRNDSLAHFRHTMKLAEEQVEEIGEIEVPDERTGLPVKLYLFEGERFATRAEAEKTRAEIVGNKARAFYADLPLALRARREDKLN